MRKNESIIVVEDDADDQELFKQIFEELAVPNITRFFSTCVHALDFLAATLEKPFLIISDINLPAMNGLEFCRRLSQLDKFRSAKVPFVFLTTTQDTQLVKQAYSMFIQGFFVKPSSIGEMRETISTIISYWTMSYRL